MVLGKDAVTPTCIPMRLRYRLLCCRGQENDVDLQCVNLPLREGVMVMQHPVLYSTMRQDKTKIDISIVVRATAACASCSSCVSSCSSRSSSSPSPSPSPSPSWNDVGAELVQVAQAPEAESAGQKRKGSAFFELLNMKKKA